jgi:lipopolysaccharide/colanic/teichoic acid biosynthesis glycosyltransferase
MQTTRAGAHAGISDVLVELSDSAQPSPSDDQSPPFISRVWSQGLHHSLSESQTTSVGTIEHVVLLDLTTSATQAAPGVAGLEGALPSSNSRFVDRLMNIALAAIALLVAAPVMILVAIAIKLTSKGPVFYVQPRIGLNRRGSRPHVARRNDGRRQLWARFVALHDDHRTCDLGGNVFMIYKFRTMCEDAECASGAVWAAKKDPRTTKIGAFLRKYRLDELPQMINVLKGDMNIVGPRPERPSIFARMRDTIDEYALRQGAKPGITGWAQINLFYDSCLDDVRKKVRYDLEYLRNKSLVRDLKIMASTLPAVLFRRRGW